jgi:hypothetical protein
MEMRTMSPVEKPIPAAIARAFSRSVRARATPKQVETQERSESRMTAA